jgi:hypothetical protein
MNVMASVEPEASAAIWRSVAEIASLVRYIATPVEAATARWPASKPKVASRSHQDQPASKSTGTSRSHSGIPNPSSIRRCRFQAWGTGLIDLEYAQAGSEFRPALSEGVEASPEDDVLADAMTGLFHDQILDEASPGHDGCSGSARGVRIHVWPTPPAFVGGCQAQANFVVEHMRRRIDAEVHGPPQSDPHRRAVWRRGVPVLRAVVCLDGRSASL